MTNCFARNNWEELNVKGLRKKIPPVNGCLKHTLPEHVTTDTYFPDVPRKNEKMKGSETAVTMFFRGLYV